MSPLTQTITLITGANSGIGLALAAQLLASASNIVLIACRSTQKGNAALKDLRARDLPGTVDLVHLDITSEASVEKAARGVEEEYGRIDALVNNAGVTGEGAEPLSQRLTAAFSANVTGPALVFEAFAPLLAKSDQTPRVINLTSGAGSISLRLDYSNEHQKMILLPYRTSKAALNMLTVCQAYEYGPKGWKVFAFCPGFTESNLGPMNKIEFGAKPTSEGAKPMLAILAGERDAEHGGYLKADGQWPW